MGLTHFEQGLVRGINFRHDKKYKGKQLMEWSTSKETVENNKQEGETVYEIEGVWVSMKE